MPNFGPWKLLFFDEIILFFFPGSRNKIRVGQSSSPAADVREQGVQSITRWHRNSTFKVNTPTSSIPHISQGKLSLVKCWHELLGTAVMLSQLKILWPCQFFNQEGFCICKKRNFSQPFAAYMFCTRSFQLSHSFCRHCQSSLEYGS